MRGEREVAGTMTATVWRADADKLHMTGNGLWQGVDATLEAEVSAMHAELVITTADELPAENEDECYNIILRDENGNILRAEIYGRKDAHTISGSFRGTGSLPETLTVELLLYSEDGGETAMPPILLTTTEE